MLEQRVLIHRGGYVRQMECMGRRINVLKVLRVGFFETMKTGARVVLGQLLFPCFGPLAIPLGEISPMII